MADPKPKQGVKVPDAEAKKVDPAKIGFSLAKQPTAEVEGQYMRYVPVICPRGDRVWLWEDTERYLLYRCAVCGITFRF